MTRALGRCDPCQYLASHALSASGDVNYVLENLRQSLVVISDLSLGSSDLPLSIGDHLLAGGDHLLAIGNHLRHCPIVRFHTVMHLAHDLDDFELRSLDTFEDGQKCLVFHGHGLLS